jgi:hypothetical protein
MPSNKKMDRRTNLEKWAEINLDEMDDLEEWIDSEIPGLPKDEDISENEASQLRDILAELYRRDNEGLNLYEPMPDQELFHASQAPERVALGGNRGGKTIVCCVEAARAITGQDPHDKYTKTDGRFIYCAFDYTAVGEVLYKKIFKPGAFKVIYDNRIGKLQPYRPWDEWHTAHYTECKMSPPLVAPRFYDKRKIAWEDKKKEQPRMIDIKNGWRLYFFSGESSPPNGWSLDALAFDEEIRNLQWYIEGAARLLDNRQTIPGTKRFRNGRFFWGATPQNGTEHLLELFNRYEKHIEDPDPPVFCISLGMFENPHITAEAKSEFAEKLANNEEEYAIRVEGKFAILGSKVYSEFMPHGIHGCRTFTVPEDWCRYVAVDPGRQIAAALFVAVPPPSVDWVDLDDGRPIYVRGKKIIYDELYIARCSASIFAERMRQKVGNQRIHKWWIDMHGGRITEMGSGRTIVSQYSEQLKIQKVACEATGYHFSWASDDVKGGIEAVKNGLYVRDGESEWLVMHEKLFKFLEEAKKYRYKRTAGRMGILTDDPIQKNNHLMDCFRYLAVPRLKYVKPRLREAPPGYTMLALQRKRDHEKAMRQQFDGTGGSIKVY